eukprot:5241909-Amphidinium_carterae.1
MKGIVMGPQPLVFHKSPTVTSLEIYPHWFTREVVTEERIINMSVDQIIDVPIPQTVEEIINVPKIVPQERVMNRTVEQIVDVP